MIQNFNMAAIGKFPNYPWISHKSSRFTSMHKRPTIALPQAFIFLSVCHLPPLKTFASKSDVKCWPS